MTKLAAVRTAPVIHWFSGLLLATAIAVATACAPTQSSAPIARPASSVSATPFASPDAGLPPPASSSRRGTFMPSDTGLGSNPTGSGPTTGTSGGSVGPRAQSNFSGPGN